MIEISHHAGTRQEGRPLRFLEPASFSTKNLLEIIGEELGWPLEASDDAPAIVRPATTHWGIVKRRVLWLTHG